MYPAAEDNYGYDACAMLCLPCVPNILVIATEAGILYHCVVLEAEEEEDGGVSTNRIHLIRDLHYGVINLPVISRSIGTLG